MATESLARARIAHAMPGRLRLRLERRAEVDRIAQSIREALGDVPGVIAVDAKPAARSLVIQYDQTALPPERLIERLVSDGGIALVPPGGGTAYEPARGTATGRTISSAMGALNVSLGKATQGFFDLRDVFPLTLFGFGLRRVAQGRLQPMPWYNLLYYGYSTFYALHGRRGAGEPDAKEIIRRRYARGELSGDQFRQMIRDLEG
jgi:copper chaperone CopZ